MNGDLLNVIQKVVKYSAGSVFANAPNIKYLQADLCNLLHFDCTRGTGPFNNQPTEWQWILQLGIFSGHQTLVPPEQDILEIREIRYGLFTK